MHDQIPCFIDSRVRLPRGQADLNTAYILKIVSNGLAQKQLVIMIAPLYELSSLLTEIDERYYCNESHADVLQDDAGFLWNEIEDRKYWRDRTS